jgi:dephospho-CoA kinase
MRPIVAISGKQGAGKSTLANRIFQLRGDVQLMKFAQPLYFLHDKIRHACGAFDRDEILVPDFAVKDGDLLQVLGDWGRKKDPRIWARIGAETASRAQANGVFVVNDDLRFENEFMALREASNNVLMVRLECDRDIRKKRVSYWREDEHHKSETDLDQFVASGKFDYTFDSGIIDSDKIAESILNIIR